MGDTESIARAHRPGLLFPARCCTTIVGSFSPSDRPFSLSEGRHGGIFNLWIIFIGKLLVHFDAINTCSLPTAASGSAPSPCPSSTQMYEETTDLPQAHVLSNMWLGLLCAIMLASIMK